jgi:hypothetical protein
MRTRKILIALAGAAALAATSAANAAVFVGSTLGCFGPSCGLANTSSTGGLTFDTGSFNQADSSGFLAIGSGSGNDTLGLISATNVASDWVNVPFSLQVNFTGPSGTSPSSALYSALVSGSVSSDGAGGAFFDFDNTPQFFTFTGGTFSLFVNDLAISAGNSNVPLNGVIRVTAAVPEPATWAMMMLGFGAIGLAMRRRRPALAQVA